MASSAQTRLAAIDKQRAQAAERVRELETEQRTVAAAVQTAAKAIADGERRAAPAEQRAKLEAVLASARSAAADPALPARVEGARARVRDLRRERAAFVTEHLRELIVVHEEEGEAAVADMLAAAEQFMAAYRRRSAAAHAISGLASSVARIKPGDVGPGSRAEPVVRELGRLLMEGEPAPTLRHYPGDPRHGSVPAQMQAEAIA
jgi:hypothetical protein